MPSKEEIKKFKENYKKGFGKELSDEKALELMKVEGEKKTKGKTSNVETNTAQTLKPQTQPKTKVAEGQLIDLTQKKTKKWHKTCWGIILLILVWPVTLIWLVWAKTKWKTLYKGLATGGIILFLIIAMASMSGGSNKTNTDTGAKNTDKTPVITITSPADNTTVQSAEVVVKGKLEPATGALSIYGKAVIYNNDGIFSNTIYLITGDNVIYITAINGTKQTDITLHITRELSAAEKAATAAAVAQKAAEAEAARQADITARTVTLSSGNYVAGTDFAAGTYTITAIDGGGNVSSSNMYGGGINAIMGTANDGFYELEYKNIKLPTGTTLTISGVTVRLTPKE